MPTSVTQGVRVTVQSQYLEDRSAPAASQFVYAYTVRIANEGGETLQLKTRHWIITDAEGKTQEVKGEGVVGAQPVLRPGQGFEYTSGTVIHTRFGSMHGTYQMYRENGEFFDAEIPPFTLAPPNALN